jgi:hypothetical protein
MPHNRTIYTFLLLKFKPIKKQIIFISEILNYIRIHLRTMSGVPCWVYNYTDEISLV